MNSPRPERRLARKLVCVVWFSLLAAGFAEAHEFEPAVLTVTEGPDNDMDVVWKVPARHAELVDVVLPEGCVAGDDVRQQLSGTMMLHRWSIRCSASIASSDIGVSFRRRIPVDVLLQVRFADGRHWSTVLTSLEPTATVPATVIEGHAFSQYFRLGIEHILLGWDHLLFVLGLLLLISGLPRLFVTITGFSIGHSITLGLAALSWLKVPVRPVEACIALSVVLLAREVIQGDRQSITRCYPWFVAGGFGLLHGMGFGSALLEIGLPEQGLWRALLAFNIGVEVGQLVFVAVVLLATHLVRANRRPSNIAVRTEWLGYPMGIIATFWVFERLMP